MVWKKISDFLFGKINYYKFIYSKLEYSKLSKEDQELVLQDFKKYKIFPELSDGEILCYLNNKINIFMEPFDYKFKRVKNYIDENNVSKEYIYEFRNILRHYFRLNDKIVTNIQLDKYLNKEIKFEQIKTIWEEISEINNKKQIENLQIETF